MEQSVNSYKTGIRSIDEQHAKILMLISSAHDNSQGTPFVLVKVFDELSTLLNVHFSYEEYLFRTHNYPDAEEHIAAHIKLKETVNYLYKKLKNEETPPTLEAMKQNVILFKSHITEFDQKYSEYLIARGVE